jgi:hypothetical protein
MATPITATTNFQQLVDASPIQYNFFVNNSVTGAGAAVLPGLYGQGSVITCAGLLGTGSTLASYFRVEAVCNTGAYGSSNTAVLGTLYSSLAGAGAGIFPGPLLGQRLVKDAWLQVTPNATVGATAVPVGLAVQYNTFGANPVLSGAEGGVINA